MAEGDAPVQGRGGTELLAFLWAEMVNESGYGWEGGIWEWVKRGRWVETRGYLGLFSLKQRDGLHFTLACAL